MKLATLKLQRLRIPFTRDFAIVGLEQLVESSELGKDGIRFAPILLEQGVNN